MTALIQLIGQRFGRLIVTTRAPNGRAGRVRWRCKCDCGGEISVVSIDLRLGDTKSCGCLLREMGSLLGKKHGGKYVWASKTHGHAGHENITPTYQSWSHMKWRCLNPKADNFSYYGGRGIRVCERWLNSFENFLADMGERPANRTLDRKDNSADYRPDNCHWATKKEQANNRRQCKAA